MASLIVTGVAELDAALAKMEAKALRKLLPKAAKEAAQITKDDYQRRTPVLTGAMRDAVVIRTRRYKHVAVVGTRIATRGRFAGQSVNVKRTVGEDIGASVLIDRKRWEKLLRARTAEKTLAEDKKRGGPFFYPATVELGNKNQLGERPLTKSLYEREQQIRAAFIKALSGLVSGS